ncbi:hypothetical protein ACO0LC_06190 [Undibacterium sp. JH2W]|uniref:hypothetical protein n=1 Tax=Undibacterium sp. JH2W TaxID=3413037 RepID=UPI003BF022FE
MAVAVLAACLVACSKPQGVASLDANAMTKFVFPLWTEQGSIDHPQIKIDKKDKADQPMPVSLRPMQVVRLSDDSAVLLVAAEPIEAGHPTPGILGAYWFKRKADVWQLEKRDDQVAWLGAFGHFGAHHLQEVSPGQQVLAVDWSNSGMGQEMLAMALFKLDAQGISPMLKDNDVLLDMSTANSNGCEERMRQPIGKKQRVRLNDMDTENPPRQCFELKSKWSIAKGKNGPGNLLIDGSAKIYSHKEIGKDGDPNSDNDGDTFTSFELSAQQLHGKQEYRYDAASGLYKKISGKDLVPDWAR